MQPTGYIRSYLHGCKGIRVRSKGWRRDKIVNRSQKRGEKHLFKLELNSII